MKTEESKKMNFSHKKITFTWSIDDSHPAPILNIWNYKGEKVSSFYVSALPKTAKNILNRGNLRLYEAASNFYKNHGVTASSLLKIIRGIIYHEFIKMFPEWYRLNRTTSWIPRHEIKYSSLQSESLMQQCRKDGIPHLIPVVAFYNKSPQELKEILPSAEWKSLCKNTYSRNRLIYLQGLRTMEAGSNSFVDLNKLPSTILSSYHLSHSVDSYLWLIKTSEYTLKTIKDRHAHVRRDLHIFRDTKYLAERLLEPFNPSWSKRRMHEEHDRLSRLQQNAAIMHKAKRDEEYAKKLKINFKTLHPNLESHTFASGVMATPLVDMQKVQTEGAEMRHCVGAYAERCVEGAYLVYSLRKGAVRSTLGIKVRVQEQNGRLLKSYLFCQHYGVCNAIIEDQDLIDAAFEIVTKLNSAV